MQTLMFNLFNMRL